MCAAQETTSGGRLLPSALLRQAAGLRHAATQDSWLTLWLSSLPFILLWVLGLQTCEHHTWFFMWALETILGWSALCSRTFTNRTTSVSCAWWFTPVIIAQGREGSIARKTVNSRPAHSRPCLNKENRRKLNTANCPFCQQPRHQLASVLSDIC